MKPQIEKKGTVRLVGTCNDGELPDGGGGWVWLDTKLMIDAIKISDVVIGVAECVLAGLATRKGGYLTITKTGTLGYERRSRSRSGTDQPAGACGHNPYGTGGSLPLFDASCARLAPLAVLVGVIAVKGIVGTCKLDGRCRRDQMPRC